MPAVPSLNVPPDGAVRWLQTVPAALRALLAQCGAGLLVASYTAWLTESNVAWPHPVLVQGVLAALLGEAVRLPRWWLPINGFFVPAIFWGQRLALDPAWFLAAFVLLLSLYWTTYRTRVPLFLSNRNTCERLSSLLPTGAKSRLLDLGCGFGGVLLAVHRLKPEAILVGRELAPLPAWIARTRLRNVAGADVRRGDFWREDLSHYDLVYAFLSPEPMSKLWAKARAEMQPGSLFVSNTFGVDETAPDLTLDASGKRPLFVWRM